MFHEQYAFSILLSRIINYYYYYHTIGQKIRLQILFSPLLVAYSLNII